MNKKRPNLLVVAVNTPQTTIRNAARRQVRQLLGELLPGETLISTPAQAIRLARPGSKIGISVSHEVGLSLVAINYAGPVGIDLMHPQQTTGWSKQIPSLTQDYLGPEIARKLATLPPDLQARNFAEAWTQHEARLKYFGLGLQEWQPELDERLASCQVEALNLPSGYIGAMAYDSMKIQEESCPGFRFSS